MIEREYSVNDLHKNAFNPLFAPRMNEWQDKRKFVFHGNPEQGRSLQFPTFPFLCVKWIIGDCNGGLMRRGFYFEYQIVYRACIFRAFLRKIKIYSGIIGLSKYIFEHFKRSCVKEIEKLSKKLDLAWVTRIGFQITSQYKYYC